MEIDGDNFEFVSLKVQPAEKTGKSGPRMLTVGLYNGMNRKNFDKFDDVKKKEFDAQDR